MRPLPTRLPQGVRLPATLSEADARDLIDTLTAHYGWAVLLIGRADVQDRLAGNVPGSEWNRRVTAEQWERVRATPAWTHLTKDIRSWLTHVGIITDAINQAHIECADCRTGLTGPPTATWGLCPTCLNAANLDDLRAKPCPATTPAKSHDYDDGRCVTCRIPAPPHTATVHHLPTSRAA